MATRTSVPATPAAPPRVGLIPSALDATRGTPAHWETGFEYRSELCGDTGLEGVCDPDPLDADLLEIGDASHLVRFEPYVIWAGVKCTAAQWQTHEWRPLVERKLAAIQGFEIEREFWKGVFAKAQSNENSYLASPDSDTVSSAPMDVVDGLGCLERGLSEGLRGQRAMIHASSDVITQLAARDVIFKDGSLWVTANDSIVVPGAGYDGSGPDAQAASDGSSWIYGTSMASVRLGPIDFLGDADETGIRTDDNTLEVRAFRAAAAGFDPCYFAAAEVDVPACGVDIGGS